MLMTRECQQLARETFSAFGRGLYSFDALGSFGSSRRAKICAFPPMIIKRLLKSCAIPPVSLPIASIFCDIASCSRAWTSFSFRVASLGRVPEYIHKADQVSCVVTVRRNQAGYEKRRAIFFDAPTLDFVFGFLDGQFQCTVWCAHAALIRSIKYSEMLADNLFRGIAHDLLCGAIPTCNVPLFIERKNCIVDHAFD